MRKVALLIETSNAYARGLLRGVIAYVREHPNWSIYLAEHGRGDKPPAWLADWDGDGILARVENAAMGKKEIGLPPSQYRAQHRR
jgi:LacI family transcriptional regulator